jgi:hypothetical protein
VADGRAELQRQIAKLRGLSNLAPRIAPEVARELERELRENVAAGRGPDGKPWEPTKDGRRPLKNAARQVSASAVGTVIIARVDGIEARHHVGAVRGGTARPMIPTGSIPDPVSRAIEAVATRAFDEHMRGDR